MIKVDRPDYVRYTKNIPKNKFIMLREADLECCNIDNKIAAVWLTFYGDTTTSLAIYYMDDKEPVYYVDL